MAYVAVAAAYAGLGAGRPLFDGFAPPPPYRWVNPPREFAAGNNPPRPSGFDVPLGPSGSPVVNHSSDDGQLILSFPAGAFAAHQPDSAVDVQLTPFDPASLGAAPPGLEADGNAYRVEFNYRPSGQGAALAGEVDVFLVVPRLAEAVLYSPDGASWGQLPVRSVPGVDEIGGVLARPGYLLGASPPTAAGPTGAPAAGGRGRAVAIVAAALALAVIVGLGLFGLRRLRRSGGR
jgi:hypothetical protein